MEHRGLPVLVGHAIALEYNPPLKLPFRMMEREFRVLLDTNAEKVSEVNFAISLSGFASNVGPLTNLVLVPDHFVPQSVPFGLHGSFSGWRLK